MPSKLEAHSPPQTSKIMGSLHKKTLNIDQRISSLKKIMKENEFLEKRLQTINPTIDIKRIENLYGENQKHSDNISKFSRRTMNSFLKHPYQTNFATQKNMKISKVKKIPTIIEPKKTNEMETQKSSEEFQPQENIKEQNNPTQISNNNVNLESNNELTGQSKPIEESKTLVEDLKQPQENEINPKQSGLLVSEKIDVETTDKKEEKIENNGNTGTNVGNINVEKSVNLE